MKKFFSLSLCFLFVQIVQTETCFGSFWCWGKRDKLEDFTDHKGVQQTSNTLKRTIGEEGERFSTVKPLSISEQLKESFKGKHPFYAVTITRTTDKENYRPLFPEENYFLFSVLNILSDNANDDVSVNKFSTNVGIILREIEEKYRDQKEEINKKIYIYLEDKSSFDKYRQEFLNSEITGILNNIKLGKNCVYSEEEKQQIIKLCSEIMNKEDINEIIDQAAFKAGTAKNHSVLQQKTTLKGIMKNLFNGELQKKYSSDISQKAETEFFSENSDLNHHIFQTIQLNDHNLEDYMKNRHINISSAYQKFREHKREYLYNGFLSKTLSLIVLNEMFFSKTVPLDNAYTDKVLQDISKLTKSNQNIFLTVNFLREKDKKFESKDLYQQYCDKELNKSESLSAIEDPQQPFFVSGEKTLDSYKKYKEKLSEHKFLEDESISIKRIKNKSYTYWNGFPVTTYKKTSYQNEANAYLTRGNVIYQFGTGEDESLRDKQEKESHSSLLQQNNSSEDEALNVGDVLKESVASETCYDLNWGGRIHTNSYRDSQKLYVLTSNTLDVELNTKNLPENIPVVLHADPENQGKVFLNTATRIKTSEKLHKEIEQTFYKSFLKEQNPILICPLVIEVNDQILTFNIFDMKKIYRKIPQKKSLGNF